MIVATGRGQKRASSEHAYDRFVKEANELITTSNAIGDGWKWIVDRNDDAAGNTARCFPVRGVTKTFLRPIAGAQPAKMANWTYEVIYSPAFDVPVVYFQAVNDDGTQLDTSDILNMINEITCHGSSGQDGNVSATIAVSQTDHPVSGVPVFFLHPCRTSDLLKTVRRQHVENAEHENMVSYLISFLSLCGPKIGLHLRPEYATRAPNLPT